MQKNKTTTYLLYALGEIVLVMIGILLAMQVNNMREEKKLDADNQITLENLRREFSQNLVTLDSSIIRITNTTNTLFEVLELINSPRSGMSVEEFEKTIRPTFVTFVWTPSSYVLEEMKSSGAFSKLPNNELKTYLFEFQRAFTSLGQTEAAFARYSDQYIDYIALNGSVRNLDALAGRYSRLKKSSITENDPKFMLKDPLFENRVDNYYYLGENLLDNYSDLREIMVRILAQ